MVVLDTNVLVAALWSRSGASFRLVEHAIEGRLAIAVSVALALEYEDVIGRAAVAEASWAKPHELDAFLDSLLASAQLVMPIRTKLRPTLRDADDEMVLECAVQAGARAIVTMNVRDFVPARSSFRVDILKPGECLAQLEKDDV